MNPYDHRHKGYEDFFFLFIIENNLKNKRQRKRPMAFKSKYFIYVLWGWVLLGQWVFY